MNTKHLGFVTKSFYTFALSFIETTKAAERAGVSARRDQHSSEETNLIENHAIAPSGVRLVASLLVLNNTVLRKDRNEVCAPGDGGKQKNVSTIAIAIIRGVKISRTTPRFSRPTRTAPATSCR